MHRVGSNIRIDFLKIAGLVDAYKSQNIFRDNRNCSSKSKSSFKIKSMKLPLQCIGYRHKKIIKGLKYQSIVIQ